MVFFVSLISGGEKRRKKKSWVMTVCLVGFGFFFCKVQKIFGQAEITGFSSSPCQLSYFSCSRVFLLFCLLENWHKHGEKLRKWTASGTIPSSLLASWKSQQSSLNQYCAERFWFLGPLTLVTLGFCLVLVLLFFLFFFYCEDRIYLLSPFFLGTCKSSCI